MEDLKDKKKKHMKKLLVILLTALLLSCSCGHIQKGGSVRPELSNIYYSSVSLAMKVNGDYDVMCSGTIIWNKKGEKLLVLTASHCLAGIEQNWEKQKAEGKAVGAPEYYIYTAHAINPTRMVVKKNNAKKDLGLLESVDTQSENGPMVEIAKNEPNIGDPIVVVSAPYGDSGTVTMGTISNFAVLKGKEMYRIDASIFYGSSGGGVFIDGKLVGVVSSMYMVGGLILVPGGGFCVGLKEIKRFI